MKTLSVRTAAPRLLLLLALLVFPLLLPPLAPALSAQGSQEGAWELVDTLVNPTNAQLEFRGGGITPGWFEEERFKGKYTLYTVSASSLRVSDRDVDREVEYHNVTVTAALQQPPATLVPGETITLTAQLSHAGTDEAGTFGVTFWYSGKGIKMQPASAFSYTPWTPNAKVESSAVYSFTVPPAREGGEIEIYASFWNAEPCLVIWKYRARPGAARAEKAPSQPEPEAEPTAKDKPRKPVIILPGIYGSYLAPSQHVKHWLYNRGLAPDLLAVDPLAHLYDDLAATLQNAGYVLGKDLFMGAYDWRMPPGPFDGAYDGMVNGLSGASITDDRYQYGVDYLGYYLKLAAERWRADHDGEVLDSVDIIAHSTGGLVARVYLQSAAYGAHYRSADGKAVRLPRVNQFIMVAVPNRGASLPWQALHNNFRRDDPMSKYVMARIITASYNKLLRLQIIYGPDYDITFESVRDPRTVEVDMMKFISLYCPTFRSLLATYPFIEKPDGSLVSANDLPNLRNDLALDLNNGLDLPGWKESDDPSRFAAAVDRTTVYYGYGLKTVHHLREMRSAA